MSRDIPKLAIRPSTRGLESIGKRGFHHVLKGKIIKKKLFFCAAIFDNFQIKMFQSETTSVNYFPQGFRISNNIGHPTSVSGGKKTFKRYLKSEHTDKHTDKHTDRRTFRLIESIGPEGRCFENNFVCFKLVSWFLLI